MKKKNSLLKWLFILGGLMLAVNIIVAIISMFFPIHFAKPHSIIEIPEIFFTFKIGNHIINITQTIINTWVIMALIMFILFMGTRNLSVDNPGFFQLILEEYYHFIRNSFLQGYGKYKNMFMPFFSAMFSLILFLNISIFLFPFVPMIKREHGGILIKPFFRTATADMNTTIGLAIVVFIIFIGSAIYRMGILGFLHELSQPFILMFPINVIGEIAKPINISMRLFGNMFAGLVIVAMLYSLSIDNFFGIITKDLIKGSFSFAIGWPGLLQVYLDFFIGILQAFVFTVLSSVYIKQMLVGEE